MVSCKWSKASQHETDVPYYRSTIMWRDKNSASSFYPPPPTFSYWLDSSTGLLSLQKTRYRSIQIPRNQILGFEVSRQLLKLIKEKIVL